MRREDWAWILACIICGLAFAGFAWLIQATADQPRYGTRYTFTTTDGKPGTETVEQFVEPVYTSRITILTNGHVQEIMHAVSQLGIKDISIRPSSNRTPKWELPDYFASIWAGIFGFLIATYLFRILEKICGRIIGVKPTHD